MQGNKVKEELNNLFLEKLGITYSEFEELDFDVQQELLKIIRSSRKIKSDDKVRVMIGSGENATFITVPKGTKVMLSDGTMHEAGITIEEEQRCLEKRMNEVLKKTPLEKIKSIVKKR